MKKALTYNWGILPAMVLALLLYGCQTPKKNKQVSTYISLNKKDKNPYGAFVFHESLKQFFPKADFKINYSHPGDNSVFGDNKPDQLYIILKSDFYATDQEADDLITFIDRGNNVFISAFTSGKDLMQFIKARLETRDLHEADKTDGMQLQLGSPPFTGNNRFTYPGLQAESFFRVADSSVVQVLGRTTTGKPNLIHLKKGDGNLYIHSFPLAFSNYFLLYHNNQQYFEKIFSLLPATTPTVIWDEYFGAPRPRKRNNGWFAAVMKNPYFRAGILTALALLLIYTLTEMRRRQRAIPIMQPPDNDTIAFVKTMGLLYYERGDHTNLAQKKSAYFMEHVRGRYKIFARETDADFIKELSYKSGVDESLVETIISQINRINNENFCSDTELMALQRNIEDFHNNE